MNRYSFMRPKLEPLPLTNVPQPGQIWVNKSNGTTVTLLDIDASGRNSFVVWNVTLSGFKVIRSQVAQDSLLSGYRRKS